jgi:hypothetical protein
MRHRDRRPVFLLVRPEVSQLHQDLEGVDRHRPKLYHEVGGRHVRILTQQEQEQVKCRRK